MSVYLEIIAVQSPFENGVDDNDRSKWTMTFTAVARSPIGRFAIDLQKLLSVAGLSTTANTRLGTEASLPTGDGPFIRIFETGGAPPLETHNGDKYERLSAQISVSAQKRVDAEARAWAVWRAIDGTRNATVTP